MRRPTPHSERGDKSRPPLPQLPPYSNEGLYILWAGELAAHYAAILVSPFVKVLNVLLAEVSKVAAKLELFLAQDLVAVTGAIADHRTPATPIGLARN